MKILEISLPEYTATEKPDYIKIGAKLDRLIEENFSEFQEIAIRAVGLIDHPGKTLDGLVKSISETGTDKYDSNRKSFVHEEFSAYDFDLQASRYYFEERHLLSKDQTDLPPSAGIIRGFNEWTLQDRGYKIRLNLLLIYNMEELELGKKIKADAPDLREGLTKCLFKFKDSKRKQDALVGIIKLL